MVCMWDKIVLRNGVQVEWVVVVISVVLNNLPVHRQRRDHCREILPSFLGTWIPCMLAFFYFFPPFLPLLGRLGWRYCYQITAYSFWILGVCCGGKERWREVGRPVEWVVWYSGMSGRKYRPAVYSRLLSWQGHGWWDCSSWCVYWGSAIQLQSKK